MRNALQNGTFLVRMSTTDDETYSISVVFVPDETVTVVLTRLVMTLLITVHVVHCLTHCRQDNQVRHIRVLADANGFSIKYDHR